MSQEQCRACLSDNAADLIDWKASNVNFCDDLSFAEAFHWCTQLAKATELPQMLCKRCALELPMVYNFLRRAKESDHKLRAIVNQNNAITCTPIMPPAEIKTEFVEELYDPEFSMCSDEEPFNYNPTETSGDDNANSRDNNMVQSNARKPQNDVLNDLGLQAEVNYLRKMIEKQNTTMAGELAEIKIYLKELTTQKKSLQVAQSAFPLESSEAMKQLEETISEQTSKELITTVRNIVTRGGISKNLHNLLGVDVIKKYNYDGIQKKGAFKTFKRLDDLFYKAVSETEGCRDNYIRAMKKGFKLEKNKIYKAQHVAKKADDKAKN